MAQLHGLAGENFRSSVMGWTVKFSYTMNQGVEWLQLESALKGLDTSPESEGLTGVCVTLHPHGCETQFKKL